MSDESKHSPEPWRCHRAGEEGGGTIRDARERVVCRVSPAALHDAPEVERRIVAAINAVASIPTEALESGALAKALEAADRMSRNGLAEREWIAQFAREVRTALRSLGMLP